MVSSLLVYFTVQKVNLLFPVVGFHEAFQATLEVRQAKDQPEMAPFLRSGEWRVAQVHQKEAVGLRVLLGVQGKS